MAIQSILLLKGKSTYDSTLRFLNEMHREWEAMGIEVTELNSYNELQYRRVRQEILEGKKHFDAVFSLNGMMLENGLIQNLLRGQQNGQLPLYCTMLMDHPMYHHERLCERSSRLLVLSPDQRHVEYLDRCYPHIWAEAFLPHGGCEARKLRPWREREILLSFVGSYFHAEKRREGFRELGQNTEAVLNALAEYLIHNTGATIEEALSVILESQGITPSPKDFAVTLFHLRQADSYVRAYFRERVIRQLLEAGIPVDVYGKGWDQFSCDHKEYLHIHPPCDFMKSLEITANSKFSLNIMPWFKAGSHDRVFTAMGCGTIPVSDRSEYLDSLEGDGGLVLYSLGELDRLPEKLHYLMEHEEEAEQIAVRAREVFLEKHTWAHRAREVIQYLEELLTDSEAGLQQGEDLLKYLDQLSSQKTMQDIRKWGAQAWGYWEELRERLEKQPPQVRLRICQELFRQSGQMEDIFARICIQDCLYQVLGSAEYTNAYLELIRQSPELSVDTKYYLYWQVNHTLFSRQKSEDKDEETSYLFRTLYRQMYQALSQRQEEAMRIPVGERDGDVVVVTTGQLQNLLHAPTKTALDRCHTLMEHHHKKVFLIDTAEVCSQSEAPLLLNYVVSEHYFPKNTWNEIEYMGSRIPVYTMDREEPLAQRLEWLRNLVEEKKPLFLLNIGGNSLITDCCNSLVPELSVATVFSSLATTEGDFQMIGHPLTQRERLWLHRFGQSEEQVVEGTFTFSLVEKTHTYTREKMRLPEGRFVIAMIGARLTGEVKREFIESLLPYTRLGAWFVFMGRMDQYREFCRTIPGFKENSTYLGTVRDVLAVLELCDLYINPPRQGGGSSVVEAMYMGLPALSYNYGDVFVNAGPDFCVETQEEMLEVLERYMTDKEFYQERSDMARERAAVLMDSKRSFGEALEEFYHRAGIPARRL